MTAPTPEAIARTLTPGQRRAVLAMSAEWGWAPLSDLLDLMLDGPPIVDIRNGSCDNSRLNDVGLAVQAHLREMNDAG